jgi:uncharacterized protein YjbJ (UPF0337 family)
MTFLLTIIKESIMNSDRIEGNWKEMKGKVQQKWGKLTDDDMDVIDGRREELVGKIQQAYGKSREEAEKEVDEYLN